jgi:hypothetical protein
MLTTLDKIAFQKEEVIITGYDIASRMELRAEAIHPLWVKTRNLTEK